MKLRADFNALKERNVDYYVMLYVLIVYAFNNQIRFNRNGEFNLPPGKRDFNQKMHSKVENFIELLQNQNATFIHSDFREIEIDKLTDKDFVYVDPPYLITCAAYNEQGGWSEVDEEDLLQKLDDLSQRGISILRSTENSTLFFSQYSFIVRKALYVGCVFPVSQRLTVAKETPSSFANAS